MKKRIIHVIDHLGEGGSQELLREMVRLRAHDEFDATVVAVFRPRGSGDHAPDIQSLGVPVHILSTRAMPARERGIRGAFLFVWELGMFLLSGGVYVFRIRKIMRKERAHIVHAHFLFAYPLAVIAARLQRVPVVFTIPALQSQMDSYSGLIFPLYRLCARFTNHFFTALPEDNPHIKLRVPKERVTAFLGVVDGERVYDVVHEKNPVTEEFHLGVDPLLLSIGRFEMEKGHHLTLRAFALLHARMPNARCIILGEGRMREEYEHYIEEHKLKDVVFLPGFRKDINHFFARADIFVRAYLYEGMNTTLQWALAYGKPIVALDNKSPNELLVHEKSALLVPMGNDKKFADALERILKNSSGVSSAQLALGARNIFEERLDIRVSISAFERVYRSID